MGILDRAASGLASVGNLPTTLSNLLFGANVLWSIHAPEIGIVFEAQFEPIGLEMSAGGSYAMTQTLGRQYPIAQWLSGQSDIVSFTGRLWARHALDQVAPRLQNLLKLTYKDKTLGRPPICVFSMGQGFMVIKCFVKSIDSIVFDSFRHDGSVRGCMFKVNLIRYIPYGLKLTDSSTPEPSTLYRVAKEGDTFESVAALLYGQAIRGVNLRKIHPTIKELAVGDLVKILPVTHSKIQIAPAPDFYLFDAKNDAARAAREAAFDEKSKPRYTFIYKV